MILRDEEANLPHSLAPVAPHFDEVVAIDTGSHDRTPQLAKQMGAEVHDFTWEHDFASARNYSISKAKSDWLFWLDGDNAIRPSDVQTLRESLPQEGPGVIWAMERVVPGGEQLWQKRCFANRPEVCFEGLVHEQLVHPEGWPQIAAQVTVLHWGYQDKEWAAVKGRYYQGLLEQMLRDNPDDFYAHFQIARCHLNQRELDLAGKHLEQVVTCSEAKLISPEIWAHSHFKLAQVLDRQGLPQQAEEMLDQLIREVPDHGLTRYQAGRLAYSHGNWQRAAAEMALAIELGINAPVVDAEPDKIIFRAHYFMGRARAHANRHREALAPLREAVRRDPANSAARTALAESLLALARVGEARAQLTEALNIRPEDRRAQALMEAAEKAA